MSDTQSISKSQLLICFTKIDSHNYKCKRCQKTLKTPNGGINNLRSHCLTHIKASKDVFEPDKKKLQTILAPTAIENDMITDDPESNEFSIVSTP